MNSTGSERQRSGLRVALDPSSLFLQICTEFDPSDLPTLRRLLSLVHTPEITNPSIDINNVCTPHQWLTGLHLACTNGHTEIVRILLGDEVRAMVNVRDKEGWTPLMCAVAEGHTEIIEMLGRCQGKICEDGKKEGPNTDGEWFYSPDGPIDFTLANDDDETAEDLVFEGKEREIKSILKDLRKKFPPVARNDIPCHITVEDECEEDCDEEESASGNDDAKQVSNDEVDEEIPVSKFSMLNMKDKTASKNASATNSVRLTLEDENIAVPLDKDCNIPQTDTMETCESSILSCQDESVTERDPSGNDVSQGNVFASVNDPEDGEESSKEQELITESTYSECGVTNNAVHEVRQMVIVSEQILYGTLEGFVYLSLDESEQSTSTYPIPDPAIADTVSVQPLYGTLDGTVYLSLNELELDTGARASVTKFYVHFDGSVYLSLHEAEQEDTSKNDIELASVVPTNDRACGPTFYRTRYDFGNLSLDDSGPAVLPIAEGGSDVKTTPDRGAECASTTKVRDLTLYGTPDGVVCLTLEESSPEALPWSEDLAPAADCETLQVYEDEDCPLSDQACEHLPERYTVQSVVLGSYEMNPVGIQYTSTNDIHKETLIFKETGCDQTSRACHISKEIERILTRINGSTNQHVDSSPCIIKIHDEIKTETGGAESSSQCDPIGDDQVNRPEILTHANASTPSYLTTVMSMTAQVHEQTKESAEVALEPTHPAEIAATTFATHNITEGTKEDLTFTKKADAKDKSLVQNSRMPDAFFNKPVEPTTERSEISATPKRSLSASATMAATRNWSIDQETKSKRSYSNTTTNQSLTSPPCEASHQPNSKQPPVKKGLVLERVAFFQPSPTGKEACTEPIRRAGSLESMDAKETEVVQLSQQSSGVHPRSYPAIPKSPRGSLVAEKVSLFQKESAAQPSPGHPKLSIQPKRPIQEETITTTSAQHAVPNGFRKASPYVTTSCTPQSQPQATPRSVSSVKERVRCFEQNATPNPQLPRKTTTTHNGQSRCMHTMLKTFLAVKAN